MKVRGKDGSWIGGSSQFNTHGLGEIIVGFNPSENGMDSMFIKDCEVFIEAFGEWKDMRQAFKDKDIIVDNYNTRFFEPKSIEDRERGYTL